jgi:hypothetical protein
VVGNHLLCELPIELGCRQAAQVIVHFLLLCIRRRRWRHPHLLRFLFGLLQVLTVILLAPASDRSFSRLGFVLFAAQACPY